MTRMAKLAGLGLTVQTLVFGCFIAVVHTEWAVPGKFAVTALFGMFVAGLFVIAARLLSFRRLLWLSGVLTIGYVAVHKVLGFTYFPGLAKDFELFSFDYIGMTSSETLFVFCCYALGAAVVVASKKATHHFGKNAEK